MGMEGCSLMRAPDALNAVITHDFCLRGSSGGGDGRRRQEERGEGRGELDEVSDYPTSSGTGKNY